MTVLLRCIKGGDLGDEFTLGQVYNVEIGNVVLNNSGDPHFINTNVNYEFEGVEE